MTLSTKSGAHLPNSDNFWRDFYNRPVGHGNVVSGLHTVELLEEFSSYQDTQIGYFERAEKAIAQLPSHFHDAALAVFGNVTYVHKQLLDATHQYHWLAVREQAKALSLTAPRNLADVHLFEVDQSGLSNKFVQQNFLSGRLNPEQSTRLQDVREVLLALEDATTQPHTQRGAEALEDLWALSSRQHWLVLTDKALSGQSLAGDIERYIALRNILALWNLDSKPVIYVCAQIMTNDALSVLMQPSGLTLLDDWKDIHILPAIVLSEQMKVNSPKCALFDSATLTTEVHDLCEWFAKNILAADKSLSTVIQNSGNNMVYGYGGSGLLLADPINTPTNSLPLLWFDSTDPGSQVEQMPPECPVYTAPFPRTHSRRGAERKRTSSTRWSELRNPATQAEIAATLGGRREQDD